MADLATVTLKIDTTGLERALRKAGEVVHRSALSMWRDQGRIRKHRARCAICSPRANPEPLSIDGHAYRRRTKRRR